MILRFNCLRTSPKTPPSQLPDFLVPALSSPHSFRPLSSTARCRSRIGSAPLSLPEGVDLRLLETPVKQGKAISMTEPPKTVEITGPLGTRSGA